MGKDRMYNNFTAMKALNEVDEELAIKAISNPDLDGDELSEILQCGIMGHVVNKETKEPSELSKKVMMAGLLNRFNQIDERENGKH